MTVSRSYEADPTAGNSSRAAGYDDVRNPLCVRCNRAVSDLGGRLWCNFCGAEQPSPKTVVAACSALGAAR